MNLNIRYEDSHMNDKVKTYLSGADLDKAINGIKRASGKLDNDIQQAGLGAINQIVQHGNTGPLNRLYNALGQGHRKQALTGWAMLYAAVTPNKVKETKAEQPFLFDREKFAEKAQAEAALTAAAGDPWFKFAPEKAPDEIPDVLAMVRRVMSKVDKAPSIRESDVGLVAELRDLLKRVDEDADANDDAGTVAEAAEGDD